MDCAALPGSLVESILFGNVKGAYTGADRAREGLVEQADGGTLFLDEVGELPYMVQKNFLRVIQERSFLPVGGKREVAVDFRIIAATNRDLNDMVERGRFRSDLLFRLSIHKIVLPPLRDRKADIRELVEYFVGRHFEAYGSAPKDLSPDFLDALMSYDWPGNVRELGNALEEALSIARHEPTLFPHHLPAAIRAKAARAQHAPHGPRSAGTVSAAGHPPGLEGAALPPLKVFREELEKGYLQRLMQATGGSRKEACRISGLSRTRLFQLLKKYGLCNSRA